MKAIAKKIASVMMASVLFGAGAVVLPGSVDPAAITASAACTSNYEDYRIPNYGSSYNYGWYPYTGATEFIRQQIRYLQAWCNANFNNDYYRKKGYVAIDVDGYYGPKTKAAFQFAQKQFGVYQDGVFGTISLSYILPPEVRDWGGHMYSEYQNAKNHGWRWGDPIP